MSPNKIECLLCDNQARLVEQNYPGYQEPDTFSIYDCKWCNTQFSYPRVETKHIYELIYKQAENVPGYNRYYQYRKMVKITEKPMQYLAGTEEAYWAINNALKQDIDKKDLKILECGCGMGYLTYSLHKEGFNITGLDISQNAIDEAIENFGELYVCANVFEYATGHKEEYDRIILTQVIEHVENPIEWIKALLTMLKKGGKIIVTTENKTIYPKNTIWQTDLPPVHSWWFSEKSFEYIANKLNVSINFVDFSDYISGVLFHEIGKVSYNQHIFDKNGEVFAICPLLTPPGIFSRSRAFIKRFSFVRYIYSRFWKNRVWFGKRRRIMGVIFEKVI